MSHRANEEFLGRALLPYGPQRPLSELVVAINQIYHAFEAPEYDARHPEITTQLPPLWQAMVAYVTAHRSGSGWRILDFGAGTGFEADQLLRRLPPGSVTALTCYDPSPEMLAHCRARIAPHFPAAIFTTDLTRLPPEEEGYDLLATNSLLHHLPDPVATITALLPRLKADAWWIAGHEPSRRFYANPACVQMYETYVREYRRQRFLVLGNYWHRLQLWLGTRGDPARQTAREAYHRGLFARPPAPSLIGRLVDFAVAVSPREAAAGRGLDFTELARAFAGRWTLRWVRSYAYMGPFYEGHLPGKWARRCRTLATQYPEDGANFCTIWQRIPEAAA